MSNKAVHLENGQMQCADKALCGQPLYGMQHTHETDADQACTAVVAIVLQQLVYVVCTVQSLLHSCWQCDVDAYRLTVN